MINISFDNPYLLLLIIPFALAIVVPYCIAIRKENKSRAATTALVCHLIIAVISVLAIAGMKHTTVMTKTEIYVLADASSSAGKNADLIDGYIKELKDDLPKNTELGVVTFGLDHKLHTKLGEEFTTIKGSGIDDSATDIISALDYASTLFSDDVIKRVVLYTDGMSTDPGANSGLVRAIENLSENDVYVDIVYVDSNLSDTECEIQISEVEFNSSTYLGNKTNANILIESTMDKRVIVKLSKDGEDYLQKTATLTRGYNIVNFDLDTDTAGEYEYRASVFSPEDTFDKNNSFDFTQRINENISVLVVTDNGADVDMIRAVYGENAQIDAYVKPSHSNSGSTWNPIPPSFDVPFTVEELCKYDEYVLSNVKVEEINNADNFVASLDMCVSVFGKSLITAGDNNLHNSEAQCVDALNSMLPVGFGNSDQDPKLYAIVIDSSRSMEFKNFDYFKMAKSAAKYLLDFLNEGDYFTVVNFSGEIYVPVTPTEVTPKSISDAKGLIDALDVTQGTMIGSALDRVGEMLTAYTWIDDKQVMLISDGMSFEGGEVYADDPVGSAQKLKNSGVTVSALNSGNDEGIATMQSIAQAGGGKYYFARSSADLVGVMFDEIADDITDTLVTGNTDVIINRPNDAVLSGIYQLPSINTYLYAKAKASAENILLVNYTKAGGTVVKAPLYAYWSYGNGKVSTLTTNLGGEWVSGWSDGSGKEFLTNITTTNTPEEKIDYPYTVEVSFDGKNLNIEIIPLVLNPDATMTVTVKDPDGAEDTQTLLFESYRYFYKLEANKIGKYQIDTTYDWVTRSYSSSSVFNISYSPEYDRFAPFSPAPLHAAARDNATVFETGNAVLKTDQDRLATYVVRFTVPLLAIAAALYVIDTIIRKLRWADIVSFFGKRRAIK